MNLSRLRQHFFIALGLGFVARTTAAYLVYGAQSVDDYSHGVLPALESTIGKEMQIPLWRSPLLVWVLTAIVRLGQMLGLTSVFSTIRFVFFVLGVFSLIAIWSYYEYVKQKPEELPGARGDLGDRLILFPLYFFALHPLFPMATTRAFGESIAMTLVLTSLLMMDAFVDQPKKAKQFFFGAVLMGIACLFRFQVGLLALGYGVYLMFAKKWRAFGLLALAGIVAAILEGAIDVAIDRWPLQTLWNYFYVNKDGAVEHSVQPWYNTWATILYLCFIPLSIPILIGLKKLTRLEKTFLYLSLFFTFMHSLIPHKEERFLFPIAPLLLYVFCRQWARAWGMKYERYFFRPVAGTVMAILLYASITSNSQSGEYEPLLLAEKFDGQVLIWDVNSVLQEGYFRERIMHLIGPKVEFVATDHWPDEDEAQNLSTRMKGVMLATSMSETVPALEQFQQRPTGGLQCEPVRKIQSLADRVIYSLNPKFNYRRKPVWISICRLPQT